MDRRTFLSGSMLGAMLATTGLGCRGRQVAHVLDDQQQDMVGSHTAGAETFGPLVEESVAKLLGRQSVHVQQVSHLPVDLSPKRICFIGVENKTVEELGDFKAQLYELIDAHISRSDSFQPISRRYIAPALETTRLRPDQLFLPDNMAVFAGEMAKSGAPFDFMLFARLTSGTTTSNDDYQRDYLLTLELVDIHSGAYLKEDARIRKGYHRSSLGKLRNYNPFTRQR